MLQPAYIRTHRIIDSGLRLAPPGPRSGGNFECRTSFTILDCNGRSMGAKSFGRSFGTWIMSLLVSEYAKTKALVYAVNPSPHTVIDLRTEAQFYAGCCPPELEALMMA